MNKLLLLRSSHSSSLLRLASTSSTKVGRSTALIARYERSYSTTPSRKKEASPTPSSFVKDLRKTNSLVPTELLTVISETIKTHGPLPISRYMTLCLSHPTLGYYTTKPVFGSTGDFVTSPEISQIFGELLGIWFVTQWLAQGSPASVRVVELGPGKGTLLTDVLRTFQSLPAKSSPPVKKICLIESSQALRDVQKQRLVQSGFGEVEVEWFGSVDEVLPSETEFTMVIAHEFFDALPIHIFENTQRGWREVMVDIADPKSVIVTNTPKPALRLVLSPVPTPASTLYTRLSSAISSSSPDSPPTSTPAKPVSLSFDTTLPPPPPTPAHSAPRPPNAKSSSSSAAPILDRFARAPLGSRMEISPVCWEVSRGVGKLLGGKKGGAGLVVDYGGDRAFGRSWRGFRKHQIVDPLTEPGHTDLTANVDFSYLSEAMADLATTHGPISQSTFLHSLGLEPRLQGLLRGATPERKVEIESAAKRLVDGLGMGKEYQVMGITPLGTSSQVGECFPFAEIDGVPKEK